MEVLGQTHKQHKKINQVLGADDVTAGLNRLYSRTNFNYKSGNRDIKHSFLDKKVIQIGSINWIKSS